MVKAFTPHMWSLGTNRKKKNTLTCIKLQNPIRFGRQEAKDKKQIEQAKKDNAFFSVNDQRFMLFL